MTFVSRVVGFLRQALGGPEAEEGWEANGQDGLWMAANQEPQVSSGPAAPEQPIDLGATRAPGTSVPVSVAAHPAEEARAMDASELEQMPEVRSPGLRKTVAADFDASVIEPAGRDSQEQAVPEQAPEPAVVSLSQTAKPEQDPQVDALSMFRETAANTEFRDMAKDIEDFSTEELVREARAVRDLLSDPPPASAPSE
jgi:hypothetical protein